MLVGAAVACYIWWLLLLILGLWSNGTVSKHDEFCIKNEEFCIKTEELCNENEELCILNDELCTENEELCILYDEFCRRGMRSTGDSVLRRGPSQLGPRSVFCI